MFYDKTRKIIFIHLAVLSYLFSSIASDRANIVFILVDDMPWYGTSTEQQLGYSGSKMSWRNTPNIDGIAKRGMTFSNAYAAAGMCAPSRCSIQTGMTAARTRFSGNGGFGEDCPTELEYREREKGAMLLEPIPMGSLNPKTTTIAEALKPLGYATAHFGKWHVYGGGPEQHGYDESDGETSNNEGGPKLSNDPKDPKKMFSMTRSSMDFIERQHKAGKPFFVQVSHYAEHSVQQSLPETLEKYKNDRSLKHLSKSDFKSVTTHAAAVEDMDTSIGMLLKKLDDLDIRKNTYVVFTSDNGKGLYNGKHRILRGEKWWLWEGGIRVPLLIEGPGIEAGSRSKVNVVGYDFLPTFYDWAGGQTKDLSDIDGVSIRTLAEGHASESFKERQLFFHYPHLRNTTPHSVMIQGTHKLFHFHELPEPYLYNLEKDLGEENNIAQQFPEKAKSMKQSLDRYLSSIDAFMPKPNPNASPDYKVFNPAKDIPPVRDLVDGVIMSKKKLKKITDKKEGKI